MKMDIEKIKQRNARVEADKAWEASWVRRIIITLGTYVIVGGYLFYLDIEDALFHAVVPALAYFLSTLTLPFFKNIWISKFYSK